MSGSSSVTVPGPLGTIIAVSPKPGDVLLLAQTIGNLLANINVGGGLQVTDQVSGPLTAPPPFTGTQSVKKRIVGIKPDQLRHPFRL